MVDEVRSKIPAAIAAKRRKEADEKVTQLVASAAESCKARQFEKALQIVNEAMAVKNATNIKQVEELVSKMGAANPELLFRSAKKTIEQRRYSTAVQWLKGYLANSHSEKKSEANRLLNVLDVVLDDNKARECLNAMMVRF